MAVLIIILWVLCAVFNFGALLADLDGHRIMLNKKYPSTKKDLLSNGDVVLCFVLSLLGPIGLGASIGGTRALKYGWRLFPSKAD